MGNSQPVIMDIEPLTGAINKYISVEYYLTSDTVVPTYKTYGAIYLDVKDSFDGRSYFYEAFLMDDKIQILRILNGEKDPVIDWSYELYDYSATESTDFYRLKDP